MKRVVSLLHRQAVRAKAEGLFFNVCGSTSMRATFVPELASGLHTRAFQGHHGSQAAPTEGPTLQGSCQTDTVFITSVFQGRRRGPIHCCPCKNLPPAFMLPTNRVRQFRRYTRRIVVTGNNSRAGNPKRNSLRGRKKWLRKSRLLKVTPGLRRWASLSPVLLRMRRPT